MELVTIKYGKTFNTGDYTSERYDVEARVDANENPLLVTSYLKALVRDLYRAHTSYPPTMPQDDVRDMESHA